jgi:hypothetical protein
MQQEAARPSKEWQQAKVKDRLILRAAIGDSARVSTFAQRAANAVSSASPETSRN